MYAATAHGYKLYVNVETVIHTSSSYVLRARSIAWTGAGTPFCAALATGRRIQNCSFVIITDQEYNPTNQGGFMKKIRITSLE